MKKIFLADDSITIQKVVELTFSEGDYEVVCVGNGAAAARKVAEVSPDIILLDVIMPEMNGYEVCAQVRKTQGMEWIPVLLLTGAFEPFDENRAREVGANGHLTKPFESRALVARVEEMIARHARPGGAPAPQARLEAAATPGAPAHTVRVKASDVLSPVPPGPASGRPGPAAGPQGRAQPAARPGADAAGASAARPAGGGNGAAQAPVPKEALDRAVREALSGISEKIVREVAWEVIPDLAEAIIRRRIRELEEEAEKRG